MRPIFCGNFEYDARQSELERLFRKYGKVDRVDMKSGFAFVYMEDERDAEDAIRALDRYEFGRKGRRLRVEWTKQERPVRKPVSSKRSSNSRPSKTLFVINFDPYNTRTRDLERHFDPYGKILNIRIRKNFAFIQYESQEDATKALEATSMSKLMDRVISVEYAIKDDDDRKNGYSPERGRDRSPRRRSDDRGGGRSPSPFRRERASPDYGRGRGGGGRSPSPYRRARASPDYGRGSSPIPKGRERSSDLRRGGRSSASPNNGRVRNSDYRRGGATPSPSPPPRRERPSPGNGRGPSPDIGRGPSPDIGRGTSPDNGRGPSPRERISPEYENGASPSPRRGPLSPGEYREGASPIAKPEQKDSPDYSGGESPPERYRSRSPIARERSGSRSRSRSRS